MHKKLNDNLPHVINQEENKKKKEEYQHFCLAWSYHTMKIIDEKFLLHPWDMDWLSTPSP